MSASDRRRTRGEPGAPTAPDVPRVRAELRARGLVALTSLGLSAALVLVLAVLVAAAQRWSVTGLGG